MSREYTFYDYVDADGDGSNVINRWLNGAGKDSKAYFANIMPYLENLPPPWMNKYTSPMHDEWKGFIEIRKTGDVQYRLLGQMIKRDVYLIASAIHKDQHYIPTVTPQKAKQRINQMIENPAKYRRLHDYG